MRVAIRVGPLIKGVPLSFTFYVNITSKWVLGTLIGTLAVLMLFRFFY